MPTAEDLLFIRRSTLRSMADAIREKSGDTSEIMCRDMAEKIRNINTSINPFLIIAGNCPTGSLGDVLKECKFLKALKIVNTVAWTGTISGCTNLKYLVLSRGYAAPCQMSKISYVENTGLTSGGDAGIFVPSAILSDFKAATNWATFADYIKPISDNTAILAAAFGLTEEEVAAWD